MGDCRKATRKGSRLHESDVPSFGLKPFGISVVVVFNVLHSHWQDVRVPRLRFIKYNYKDTSHCLALRRMQS